MEKIKDSHDIGNIFPYDTNSWILRIPLIFVSVLYLTTLIFVSRSIVKGLKTVDVKYGKNLLVLYIIAIAFTCIFRIMYIFSGSDALRLPHAIYGMCAYFPGITTLTACTSFLNYLFKSLYSRFDTNSSRIYAIFEKIFLVFLPVIWFIIIGLFIGAAFNNDNCGITNCMKIFYATVITCSLIVMTLLFLVILIYFRELKKFPLTFNDKKGYIILVMLVTFLQISAKVGWNIFNMTGKYLELEKESEERKLPIAQSLYAAYYLITDILLLNSYTLYLRKDISHLIIFEAEINENAENDNAKNTNERSASVTENMFTKGRYKNYGVEIINNSEIKEKLKE